MDIIRKRVIAASCVVFLGFSSTFSQRSRLETIPVTDPIVLADALANLLAKHARLGMTDDQLSEALTGKPLPGSQTVDSFFAFKPSTTGYVGGRDAQRPGVNFWGNTYRVVPETEFPEPVVNRGSGQGTGSAKPLVNSRDELVRQYSLKTPAEVWSRGTIRLRTVVASPRSYGDAFASETDRLPTVLTPQTHYELAFGQVQELPLVEVEDTVFSLGTYRDATVSGPGLVTWVPDQQPGQAVRDTEGIFIVKLVPPFFKTDEVSKYDSFARMQHTATRKRIYVEIVAVWLRDVKTGEIYSKEGKDANVALKPPEKANTKPGPLPANRKLVILRKPAGQYTQVARENGVSGTVVLRVTFLPTGQIGAVQIVRGLDFGLTEQAVNAAKQITFEPEVRKGKQLP